MQILAGESRHPAGQTWRRDAGAYSDRRAVYRVRKDDGRLVRLRRTKGF
jgi:hypothetical protein